MHKTYILDNTPQLHVIQNFTFFLLRRRRLRTRFRFEENAPVRACAYININTHRTYYTLRQACACMHECVCWHCFWHCSCGRDAHAARLSSNNNVASTIAFTIIQTWLLHIHYTFCIYLSLFTRSQGKPIRWRRWFDYAQNFLLCSLGNGMPRNMHGRKYIYVYIYIHK